MDNDRTRLMLEAPIARTLLRLAAPTLVVVMMQTLINVIETYFVGRLGTDALAGVSLVFPALMLMTTMSAGADADAILVHAIAIAALLGALFSAAALVGGPALYAAMGGTGGALAAAVDYSNIIFAGAVAFWLLNLLAAVLRGTGNMTVPALVSVAGALLLIPISPALIMGWGPLPRLGVVGGAIALVGYYVFGAAALLLYFLLGKSTVHIHLRGVRFSRAIVRDILGVGAISSLMTVQSNLMVLVTTGLVGSFGTAALAGYGLAARLDYLLIPLLFALGTAAVTMVGTSVGAGRIARAERVAWTAAGLAFAATELVGLIVAVVPNTWLGLFSDDAAVLAHGGLYLHLVGPFYGAVGVALLLFFASQGAGRMRWPFLAGIVRFTIVIAGGWIAVRLLGAGLPVLFAIIGLSGLLFGAVNGLAIRAGAWRSGARHPRPRRVTEPAGWLRTLRWWAR
jgi:Na+-driven multidrug efflux pump